MTHLVIVSTPRTGANMVRSMLRADPAVTDVGWPFYQREAIVPAWPTDIAQADIEAWYQEHSAGCILVSNVKLHSFGNWQAHLQAAAATDGRFIYLQRRDRFAQVASWLYARKRGAHFAPLAVDEPIHIEQAEADEWLTQFADFDADAAQELLPYPHQTLFYEDITPAVLAQATGALGIDVSVGNPTTPKISPALSVYVENLSDFAR